MKLYEQLSLDLEDSNSVVYIFNVGDVEDPHLVAQMHISEKFPETVHKYCYTLLNKEMSYEVRVYERSDEKD